MTGKERRGSPDAGGLNLGAGLGLSGLSFGSSSPLASPLQPGDGSFGGKSRSVQLRGLAAVTSEMKVKSEPEPGSEKSSGLKPTLP